MSRIAILHPQCVRLGGAIQMALQTAGVLQEQGHTVTLYTFSHSLQCFPELQENVNIREWGRGIPHFFPGRKLILIITLAWHVRHVDIIVANNPPMQIVAAFAKLASLSKTKDQRPKIKKGFFSILFLVFCFRFSVKSVWWHHHIPWYFSEKNTKVQSPKSKVQNIKGFFERHFVIPFIDEMIATSHFIAEQITTYCGREATVIHPIIMTNDEGRMTNKEDCFPSSSVPDRSPEGRSGVHRVVFDSEGGAPRLRLEGAGTSEDLGTLPTGRQVQANKLSRSEAKLGDSGMNSEGREGRLDPRIIHPSQKLCFGERKPEDDGNIDSTSRSSILRETRLAGMTGTITLFTHGRLEPGKGIETILSIYERIMTNDQGPMTNEKPVSVIPDDSAQDDGLLSRHLRTERSGDPEIQSETVLGSDSICHSEIGSAPIRDPEINSGGREHGLDSRVSAMADHENDGNMDPPVADDGQECKVQSAGAVSNSPLQISPEIGEGVGGVKLILFGTGSLESTLKEQGIDVQPFDPNSTLRHLARGHYGQHILGVYCSEIEGFGMASLESQMMGIPTVILDRAGSREAIVSNDVDKPVGYLVKDYNELLRIISHFVQFLSLPKCETNVNFLHHRDYFFRPRLSTDLHNLISKIHSTQ